MLLLPTIIALIALTSVVLKSEIIKKEEKIKNLEEDIKILDAKMISFEQIKAEKIQVYEKLKITEQDKNNLKRDSLNFLLKGHFRQQ